MTIGYSPTTKKKCATIALVTVVWSIPVAFAQTVKEPSITEIRFHRALPHAFYDQTVASIATIYRNGQVLMAERTGYIGDSVYSLVMYRKEATDPQAYLDAVAVNGTRAWRLADTFPADELHRIHSSILNRIRTLR